MLRRVLKRLMSPRLLKFGVVGASGVVVNLGSLWILADVLHLDDWVAATFGLNVVIFGVDAVLSSATAIEISIIWNFLLNNSWTFRDRNERARVGFIPRLLRYNLVSLVGLAIQLAAFVILTAAAMRALELTDAGFWKYPSQLVGIGVAMAWNLLANFYFTWAQHDESAA